MTWEQKYIDPHTLDGTQWSLHIEFDDLCIEKSGNPILNMNYKGWNIMIRKPCKLDTDFQRSITFQRNIEVWMGGELDTIGRVEKFTDDSVKIDGKHFMRENCKFWIV